MEFPKRVYKLDSNVPLFLQTLKMAGWYPGRKVDISELEEEYYRFGYILTDTAKNILSEYYGIRPGWNFRWQDKAGRIRIGGYDYSFETQGIYDECDDIERNLLPINERTKAIPILLAGFHQFPKTVWLGNDNLLYGTTELDDKPKIFHSVHELLEYDIQQSSEGLYNAENVYVTFESQRLLHWDD